MFIVGVQDQALDEGKMMGEDVINELGALDDEGAFSVSNPLISEESSYARRLRAGQQGGESRQSSRLRLPTLSAGCRFRRTNPLRSRLGALEKGQLAARTIILML